MKHLLLTTAAISLLTVAAHAQTSFLGIKLNQPISASLPACPRHSPAPENCWFSSGSNFYTIAGNPLGELVYNADTDDKGRVIHVAADVADVNVENVLAAMKQKYGAPQSDDGKDVVWMLGKNTIQYVRHKLITGLEWVQVEASTPAWEHDETIREINRLAKKF